MRFSDSLAVFDSHGYCSSCSCHIVRSSDYSELNVAVRVAQGVARCVIIKDMTEPIGNLWQLPLLFACINWGEQVGGSSL